MKDKFTTVFLDRDGTINEERAHVFRIEDFEFIPGVIPALQKLNSAGIKIVIVTNQGGIGKGFYTEDDYQKLTKHMLAEFAKVGIQIEDVLHCPHHPEAVIDALKKICTCRKPNPGMLKTAIDRHDIDPKSSVIIGDKATDIAAGKALGLTTIQVETGYGTIEKNVGADLVVKDLAAAVEWILS